MPADIQALSEKIQTSEKLELADFTEFYNAVRNALSDGRLGPFELIGLVKQLFDLIAEISSAFQGQPQPDFGFLKQA
jgi:hypothetical protein